VVEERQGLGFGLDVGEFFRGERVFIDDFESEVGIGVGIVSDPAEEDPTEIARTEKAEELEVAEVESAVAGEVSGGFDGGPVGIGAAVGAAVLMVVDVIIVVGVVGCGRGEGKALVEAKSKTGPSEAASCAGGSERTIGSC